MSNISTKFFSQKVASAVQAEFSGNVYYFAVSKHSPWDDENNPDTSVDTTEAINNFHREMMFGKRIKESNVAKLIGRNLWSSGTVYAQYDDTDELLFDSEFYVVNGSEQVYKCLLNNDESESTSEPTLVQTDRFQTADGYIWKYMYTISSTNNTIFSTSNYIPVDVNSSVTSAASNGSIDVIFITSPGSNYRGYVSGTIASVISNTLFQVTSTQALSAENFFYNTSGFYITDGTGEGQLTTVSNYIVNSSGYFVSTTDALNSPALVIGTSFRIAPQVRITGDGSGAKAVCTVNTISNTFFVETIEVVNSGSNYSYTNVSIIANPSYGSNAAARAVLPPRGGHGFDPAVELGCKHLGISLFFNNNESSSISTDVSFRQAGIISAPEKFTAPTANLTFNALSGVSNTNDTIAITNANTHFKYNDKVRYVTDTGNTAIGGLSNGNFYYVVSSNTTTLKLSSTLDGAAINLTSGSSETGHRLFTTNTFSSNVFNSITTLTVTTGAVQFIENEIIVGSTSSANGRVAFANSTQLQVTSITGTFSNSETVVGQTTTATGTITSINNPDIRRFTSPVLYIDNIEAIARSDSENEQAYLIITV